MNTNTLTVEAVEDQADEVGVIELHARASDVAGIRALVAGARRAGLVVRS